MFKVVWKVLLHKKLCTFRRARRVCWIKTFSRWNRDDRQLLQSICTRVDVYWVVCYNTALSIYLAVALSVYLLRWTANGVFLFGTASNDVPWDAKASFESLYDHPSVFPMCSMDEWNLFLPRQKLRVLGSILDSILGSILASEQAKWICPLNDDAFRKALDLRKGEFFIFRSPCYCSNWFDRIDTAYLRESESLNAFASAKWE